MNSHIALIFVLATILIAILVTLLRRDRNVQSAINLEDLLIGNDGRISKAAFVLLGSFLMTTWVIVYLTYTGKLTDTYFGAYLATWVAPTITMLFRQPVQTPAQESKS